jgi:hypothetical protein
MICISLYYFIVRHIAFWISEYCGQKVENEMGLKRQVMVCSNTLGYFMKVMEQGQDDKAQSLQLVSWSLAKL